MRLDVLALRAAARYAAKAMKPEKLRELMMKLRKGAGSSLKMSQIRPVFDTLEGWVFEEILLPKPEYDYHPDNRGTISAKNRAAIESDWKEAKGNEVKSMPHTFDSYSVNDQIYMDVGEIKENPEAGSFYFEAKAWRMGPGVKITAPNRSTFEVAQSPSQFDNEYISILRNTSKEKLLDWLKKDTPFYDQLNTWLGTDSIEHVNEQKERERKQVLRTQGNATCPACFGQFKLTPKARNGQDKTLPGMVLHGYKRPGTGVIEGNCFGQDWPPYELSAEGTKAWVVELERIEKNRKEYLKKLRAGEITVFGDPNNPRKTYTKEEMSEREWEALGRLPVLQSVPFEELVFGTAKTATRAAARFCASGHAKTQKREAKRDSWATTEPTDVARRALARYLKGTQLVTKELAESLARLTGLSPITTTKLQALARALDYESLAPFPLAELPLYLTERGAPEEDAEAIGKAKAPSPKAKQLSWHDTYSLLSRETGKSVVYEGGLEHDSKAVTSALVWVKAVKALKPKARQIFDRYVKKVRLRNPRGSEDASWEHGGVVALVVGKPLTAAAATSFLTHELGHALEEAHSIKGGPWGVPPFISDYAESRPDIEDFAECFRVYIEKPSELRRVSLPKFEAMRSILG